MKLGIFTNDLSMSQKGYYLIKNLNDLVDKHPLWNICVFRTIRSPLPVKPNFAIMAQGDGWGFEGVVISTDLDTTYKIKQLFRPQKRYFYVWELEWLYMDDIVLYSTLVPVLLDPDVELITRSEEHNLAIQNAWKKPKFIMDNFDYKILEKIVQCNMKT